MRNKLLTVVLTAITAGMASAQVAGSFDTGLIALQSSPAPAAVVTSGVNMTNTFQPGPAINATGSLSLGPTIGEPLRLDTKPWLPDEMAVEGGEGWSFVDSDEIQLEGGAFSEEFDLLRATTHSGLFKFGRDSEIKFVESHTYRPGLPTPVGLSYPVSKHRVQFFGEIAPIFDATPANALGWGGGFGIRFYIGH
jgi:hypothetical protein